jgi:hypothetical protein
VHDFPLPRILLAALTAVAFEAVLPPVAVSQTRQEDPLETGSLVGKVISRFEGNLRPLPLAMVEVNGPGVTRTVLADREGRYEIRDLPDGSYRVSASHAGHASVTLSVRLSGSSRLDVDMELEAEPLELAGVEVPGETSLGGDAANPSDPTFPAEDPELALGLLQVGPGMAEAGLAQAVHALPGNEPSDPSDVLFMRGSTAELKLVLLDGVPVVAPFHIAGLLRSFEPGVLESARFHLGGAPARYDGGLTHILDLRTRVPRTDRPRASGSVDLLATSLAAEVPLGGRVGMLVAARHLHGLGQSVAEGPRPYGFGDALVSVSAEPGRDQHIRATGFWNHESVRLTFDPAPATAEWGNEAISGAWDGRVGGVGFTVSGGASRYDARLPFRPTATETDPEPSQVLATALTERVRLMAEATWGDPVTPARAGFSFEDVGAGITAERRADGARSSRTGSRSVAAAFAEMVRQPAPGVTVRAGLRADVFEGDALRLAPRVSVAWGLSPTALLTVATGRYHQVVPAPVTEVVGDRALTSATSGRELLPIGSADHVVLSLDQRLATSVGLALDGYWKRFLGVSDRGDDPLYASGLDLRVRSSGERVGVWLGYGLSWLWAAEGLAGSEFTGRHLLSAGLSGAVAGPVRAEATLAYGAGLPSTGIPFGNASAEADYGPGAQLAGNSGTTPLDVPPPDASFLRIDLEVWADFRPVWGGHEWRARPYVRLLNPLRRRDALFYLYQPGQTDVITPLSQRPVLPVLGISFAW